MIEPRALLTALGHGVRSLRKHRGWSRRQLAAETGISERFLADVESGRANPSVIRLCELAHALETTPAALLETAATDAHHPRVIALLGLRGAGKSAVGQVLAERLGIRFVELDAEIERSTGLSVGQIFDLNGEGFFRRAERETLREVLADTTSTTSVLATGGGIVTDRETFELLQHRTWTVWLRARPEDHWSRVVAQGDTRPMKDHDEAFEALHAILRERERLYELADTTVDTSGRTVDQVAAELEQRWRAAAAATD